MILALPKKRPIRRRKKRARIIPYASKKAGAVRLRSLWELEYLMWLDSNPDVVAVQYEKLVIAYRSNLRSGRVRRYFPDFVILWSDGRKEIIEIKPLHKTINRIVVKKAEACRAWAQLNGMTYSFVTEVELKALGLLKRKKTVKKVVKKAKK